MNFEMKRRRTTDAASYRAWKCGYQLYPWWSEQDQRDFEREVEAVQWAVDHNLLGSGEEAQWCRRWVDSVDHPEDYAGVDLEPTTATSLPVRTTGCSPS